MDLALYLFGMFLGYCILSKRLRHLIKVIVLWFYRKWRRETLPSNSRPVKGVAPTPSIPEPFNPPIFGSSKDIKGVIVSPEDFERLMNQNKDLREANK